MQHFRRTQSKSKRGGVAAVEAAITLPLLVVLVLGSIEAANAIFLKQSMTIAAYEAAKIAAGPQGTMELAELRCREVLASRDVPDFNLSFVPADLNAGTSRGTQVTVTLTVDADAAVIGPLWFFTARTLEKKVEMVRL